MLLRSNVQLRSGITALGRAAAFLPPVLRRTLRDDAGDGR